MPAPFSLVKKSRYREIDACLETLSDFVFPKSMFLATTLPSVLAATRKTKPKVCKQIRMLSYPAMIYIPPPRLGYWTFSLGNSIFTHTDCSRCERWKGLIVEKVG